MLRALLSGMRAAISLVLVPFLIARAEATPARPAEAPSPGTALTLSLGTTLGGLAVGAGLVGAYVSAREKDQLLFGGVAIGSAALVVGPSAGLFYAGEARRWTLWTRLGLLVASVGTLGAAAAAGASCAVGTILEGDGGDEDCGVNSGLIAASAVFGGGVLGLAVYDIVDSPRAARRARERAAFSAGIWPLGGGALISAHAGF